MIIAATDCVKSHRLLSAAQGHASFTIEFDNTSPGKVTIKDHVAKFTPDHHRPRSKKSGAGGAGVGGRDLSTLQAAMMASESKVADWLAQNDPTLVRSESTEDDSKSIKSDVPVHLKRLKGERTYFYTAFITGFWLLGSLVLMIRVYVLCQESYYYKITSINSSLSAFFLFFFLCTVKIPVCRKFFEENTCVKTFWCVS